MKKSALLLVIAALLLPAGGNLLADDAQTFTGEYVWTQRNVSDPIEAVFTPTGDGKWDVAFHFKFRGEPHVYEGQAEGSLTDGALHGEVRNENRQRTFTFKGTFADGVFNGTHREITRGRERDTGTITLKS
ncbi:MAG: hypothetical protein AAF657_12205 [Acidobacteriota bacterium]